VTIHVPNPEVLRAGIKHAEENLAQWNQGTFVSHAGPRHPCGSRACLAGHILLAQGFTWEKLLGVSIPETALEYLGLDPESDDGRRFDDQIFYMTENDAGNYYGRTPELFAEFKAAVAALTGVEL
jgi:hypothetical protein